MIQEECEDSVLLGREVDMLSISRYGLSSRVDMDIADIGRRLSDWSSSASHDILYSQPQFLQVKRLHQIVIRPECEPLDAVYLLVSGSEEEKRDSDTSIHQYPHECEPIDAWDHTIDDETVIRPRPYHIKSPLPIVNGLSMVSFRREIEGDILGDTRIVFDDEDGLHDSIIVNIGQYTSGRLRGG